jgi:protein involved in polysaccharide export with SLBB domain
MKRAYGLIGPALLAACASSDPPACDPSVQLPAAYEEYRLGPRDRLRLTVFRQTDMSGEFAIDGQGFLALPLGGRFKAAGLTPRGLEGAIEAQLKKDQFLVDPKVNVEVLTYRPFYALGEFSSPGSYEYQDGMTVRQALALTGGYTYRADLSGVTIDRGGCRFDAKLETPIQPGDIITLPERFF